MKKGFTLAELLIVLGITGITAAILLPAVNNLMPDKTKIMYLKAYDELQRDIQSLVSNSSLYPSCLEENNTSIGCSEHPLINTSKPLTKKFQNIEGNTKLCKLLAFTMDTEESCQEGNYTYSDTTFNQNLSFTTKNGMQWKIVPQTRTIESDKAIYQSDVYVDVDPSKKSKNCLYDSVSCKEPDRFKFLVAADGSVIPADPMGLMYVNTRKSYLKNKGQKADGEVAVLLDDELRAFGYRPCGEITQEPPQNCEEGYVWDGTTCSPQTPPPPTCPEGYVWNGTVCSPTSGGMTVLDGQMDCTSEPNRCFCGDTYNGRIINCVQYNYSNRYEYMDVAGGKLEIKKKPNIEFDYPTASQVYITSEYTDMENKTSSNTHYSINYARGIYGLRIGYILKPGKTYYEAPSLVNTFKDVVPSDVDVNTVRVAPMYSNTMPFPCFDDKYIYYSGQIFYDQPLSYIKADGSAVTRNGNRPNLLTTKFKNIGEWVDWYKKFDYAYIQDDMDKSNTFNLYNRNYKSGEYLYYK